MLSHVGARSDLGQAEIGPEAGDSASRPPMFVCCHHCDPPRVWAMLDLPGGHANQRPRFGTGAARDALRRMHILLINSF
jgi:hypothetical protein